MPESSTNTLIEALNILARDIQSQDGVANAAISEAATRLSNLHHIFKKLGLVFMWQDRNLTNLAMAEIDDIRHFYKLIKTDDAYHAH